LTDADVNIVLPWIAAGVAAEELAAAVSEAGDAIDVLIECICFSGRLLLLSSGAVESGEQNFVRIVRVTRDVDEIVL
jgi:hypothetical protein